MNKSKLLSLLLSVIFLTGCYPYEDDTVTDYDVVASVQNPNFDYGTAQTFALATQIPVIEDQGGTPVYMDQTSASQIITTIRSNLTARGYTEVTTGKANLVVLTALYKTTNYYVSYWWDYWGYWGYWGYPTVPVWGWGTPVVSGYTSGSLVITVLDGTQVPNTPSSTTPVPVAWLTIENGIASGSTSYDVTRAVNLTNQAFVQSPYFQSN